MRIKRTHIVAAILMLTAAGIAGGCSPAAPEESAAVVSPVSHWDESAVTASMELLYADQFAVDYYRDGYALITVKDSGRCIVVPEGREIPAGLPADIPVVQQPLRNIYLVATSAMDLFCSLEAVEQITLSGTDVSGWHIEAARQALTEKKMLEIMKYRRIA